MLFFDRREQSINSVIIKTINVSLSIQGKAFVLSDSRRYTLSH